MNQEMTREDIKNSKHGLRFNAGKPRWGLMHYGAMKPMIDVLDYGSKKYDDRNWKKGMNPIEILECAQRHLAAMMDGEMFDKESGLPHVGHLLCNGMMFSYFMHTQEGWEKFSEMFALTDNVAINNLFEEAHHQFGVRSKVMSPEELKKLQQALTR